MFQYQIVLVFEPYQMKIIQPAVSRSRGYAFRLFMERLSSCRNRPKWNYLLYVLLREKECPEPTNEENCLVNWRRNFGTHDLRDRFLEFAYSQVRSEDIPISGDEKIKSNLKLSAVKPVFIVSEA